MRLFLTILAVGYLISGLWCLFDAEGTAAALGYAFANPAGRAEYQVVYGGLQLGLAGLFFWNRTGPHAPMILQYVALQHAILALIRGYGVLAHEVRPNLIFASVWALEVIIAVAAFAVTRRRGREA